MRKFLNREIFMPQTDNEIAPLQLPRKFVQEYRRIAKAEGLTGSEVVVWCLGCGYRGYVAGDRPSAKVELRPLS